MSAIERFQPKAVASSTLSKPLVAVTSALAIYQSIRIDARWHWGHNAKRVPEATTMRNERLPKLAEVQYAERALYSALSTRSINRQTPR